MGTKMNANIAKRVSGLKINAKSEEEARKKLLAILDKNDIDGMEEEDTETLLDIAESLVLEEPAEEETEEQPTEEEENDNLAKEVEDEESSKEETESEEETEEEGETDGDSFSKLDRKALKSYIKENELDVKVKKSMSDEDIREAIREASVEEEEDEAPKEVKKTEKKEVKKTAEKTSKKEVKKTEKKRNSKIDPKNNEDDRKVFDVLKKVFPEETNAFCWTASAGVTIKHKGKNSQRALVTIENCSKNEDGSIKCNLYLLTFTKKTEILDNEGIDYDTCWSGAPFIKNTTLDEAIEIIKSIIKEIETDVTKIDKKLGENRKKMEDNLEKKTSKKVVTKKVEVEEPEDEEEEEEETPVVKKTKKVSKKK